MINNKVLEQAKKLVNEYRLTKKKKISLIVHHNPTKYAMKRPRTSRSSHIYVPDAARNKKDIREAIDKQVKKQTDKEIVKYPIEIKLVFYCAIPKNFNRVERLLANKKYLRPITKPDIDNMEKTYLDALTGVIWCDDSQIVDCHTSKFYSDEPRVEIFISYKPFYFSNKQK